MSRHLTLAGGIAALALATPVSAEPARAAATPYIEATQGLDADLNSGDAVTYTGLAVGIDASVATRRVEGQVSYRYEHRFAWEHDIGDDDVQSGLARASVKLTRDLSVEGGALATRSRADIGGGAPDSLVGNGANTSNVYALYAGPTFSHDTGELQVNGAYRIGYTKVEAPRSYGVAPGAPRLDRYDDALGQVAAGSIALAPGAVLPVGLSASAGWSREDAGQLDGRLDDVYVRGDVLAPLSGHLAVTAGVGYEKLATSQRDPVVDGTGQPLVDDRGRFVTDPSSPRRIAYRTDGVYYDAGVVWRPNRRTSVEGHVGRRYGSMSYTGLAHYQASPTVGFSADVYDVVTTFGQQLQTGLANLPTQFVAFRDQLSRQFNRCIFGTTGAAPGACLNNVFQAIETASYRARGVDAVLSASRGGSAFGVGAGYANRRVFAPDLAPGIVAYGQEDESYYAQVFFSQALGSTAGFDVQAFLDHYDSELAGSDPVLSVGANAGYYQNFGHLGTTASLGLYHTEVRGFDDQLSLQALIAARYGF